MSSKAKIRLTERFDCSTRRFPMISKKNLALSIAIALGVTVPSARSALASEQPGGPLRCSVGARLGPDHHLASGEKDPRPLKQLPGPPHLQARRDGAPGARRQTAQAGRAAGPPLPDRADRQKGQQLERTLMPFLREG
jgi:hypothetical protein